LKEGLLAGKALELKGRRCKREGSLTRGSNVNQIGIEINLAQPNLVMGIRNDIWRDYKKGKVWQGPKRLQSFSSAIGSLGSVLCISQEKNGYSQES
jgi:hypothetical protein